jgi:uncharacterized membrane protein YGL010W
MTNIQQWLSEYGESHQNDTNKTIHWICVPAIFFSIVGFLYSIKLPFEITGHRVNIALIAFVLIIFYYFLLSKTLWIGMFLFGSICLLLCHLIAAWIGQFYGHKIEGKKPSFFKDLQFLLIGPAWLMSFIYKRIGIAF